MNTYLLQVTVDELRFKDQCSARFHAMFTAMIKGKNAGNDYHKQLGVLLEHGYAFSRFQSDPCPAAYYDIGEDNGFTLEQLDWLLCYKKG